MDAVPLLTNHFKWKTEVNFSTNRNKIISLHEALKEFLYGPTSFSSSYAMKLVKGGSIGDIYGKAFVRDDAGNIVYGTEGDNTGMPLVEGDGNTVKVGNANPKLMLYNPQIQISAESETKRSIFREKDKTKRSKKESAQHSKSRNKSFVMTSVSAL